ncbi:MAG: TRAP transporter small permease [Deltaproteobacteria bacterium HGW-Deltaproteobacteria-21]|jgi:TRAP-type C4-dicarboxylate transport system permease small subunit|nr:MAG: TRAP transporter small permease [Deltaproteobacteria bacterium HGW-Deltaproteobacteria-21]
MEVLERITKILNHILLWIAGLFLVAMVALTCADIICRFAWVPILGSVELVALFGSIVTAFALGYTQMRKGHTSVDVLIVMFPERVKRILNVINNLVCMSFFAMVGWRITIWSTTLRETGELTETLRIIYYPFSYAVAFGCAVLGLVFLTDLIKSLIPTKQEGSR